MSKARVVIESGRIQRTVFEGTYDECVEFSKSICSGGYYMDENDFEWMSWIEEEDE